MNVHDYRITVFREMTSYKVLSGHFKAQFEIDKTKAENITK